MKWLSQMQNTSVLSVISLLYYSTNFRTLIMPDRFCSYLISEFQNIRHRSHLGWWLENYLVWNDLFVFFTSCLLPPTVISHKLLLWFECMRHTWLMVDWLDRGVWHLVVLICACSFMCVYILCKPQELLHHKEVYVQKLLMIMIIIIINNGYRIY